MFSRNVLRSVQSVKYLALFNLEGTEEEVPKQEEVTNMGQ